MTIETVKSWADEVIENDSNIQVPASSEVFENGLKVVTEYKLNEDGKKVKCVRTYKVEKRIVSKTIAYRKTWKKFGESANDKPGPDPATTIAGDDVYMQFITSKEDENKHEDDSLDKLKAIGDKNVIKCRNCAGDHWTTHCPWKDVAQASGKLDEKKASGVPGASGTVTDSVSKTNQSGKYIPPSLRGDGSGRRDPANIRRDDTAAIRISNLSESTTEMDVEDLVKVFGPIQKLYLAKDKTTGHCKGFAFVHFKFRADARMAIECLSGHGYDHLILDADWSTPRNN